MYALSEACSFIDKALKKADVAKENDSNVLIHCEMGQVIIVLGEGEEGL
jgi:protein-tyrosine phosphatase